MDATNEVVQQPYEDQDGSSTWWHILLGVLIFGVYVATAWYYFSRYGSLNHENVQAFVGSFGNWSPVAYVTLYFISSPIPYVGMTLATASGYIFGQVQGTIYAVLVSTLSSLVPFLLVRRLGREWVLDKIHADEQWEKVYQWASQTNEFLFVLLMRLIPVLPWEAQNYIAGLTPVSVPKFLLATAIGTAPGTFLHAFLGSSLTDFSSWQFWAALSLNGLALLIPLSAVLVRRYKKKQHEDKKGSQGFHLGKVLSPRPRS